MCAVNLYQANNFQTRWIKYSYITLWWIRKSSRRQQDAALLPGKYTGVPDEMTNKAIWRFAKPMLSSPKWNFPSNPTCWKFFICIYFLVNFNFFGQKIWVTILLSCLVFVILISTLGRKDELSEENYWVAKIGVLREKCIMLSIEWSKITLSLGL